MKKLVQGILVGLCSAAVALSLWGLGLLDRWEYNTWAWRVRAFARPGASTDQIRIILLDQASLDWGKNENGWSWPWPREVYAPVLDFCRRGGAKAVAFDVLYTEPSVYGVADDEAFGAAIAGSGAFVGAVFLGERSGELEAWPGGVPDSPVRVDGLEPWLTAHPRSGVAAPRSAFPVREVATNAALLANVSDTPDEDGLFRRVSLFRVFDGRVVPSLGLAAWLAAPPGAEERQDLRVEEGWLHVGRRRVAIDAGGRAIVRFRGPTGTHRTLSAAAVVQSELRLQAGEGPAVLDPVVLKDSYVFFGFSAPGLLDLRPTPVGKVYPGVELHATALDNLLEAAFLRDVPNVLVAASALLLALLGGVAVTLTRRASQSVVAFIVCLPLPVVLGFAAYAGGYWWPIVVGECGVALALVGAVVVNYAREGRQKAFIKSAFKQYLGPQVIEQILEDPSRLQLGGEKRELTLFFSDIEKFSSFSEKLDPPTLTALLNDYLSDMSRIIMEEGGYLDKYIGDAIVAFWNAPLEQADHAVRACRAAVRCQRALAERREAYRERTGATVKMRIGINSGDVVVGNMGSRERFNYTVLGDAANLASRLEGANKAFGTYLMVSEATWQKTQGAFVGRELGRLRVVGRETPVRVYEVFGLEGEAAPEVFPEFEKGRGLCYERRWGAALECFQKWPEDAACKAYIARLRPLVGQPPSAWDGVWNLTEK